MAGVIGARRRGLLYRRRGDMDDSGAAGFVALGDACGRASGMALGISVLVPESERWKEAVKTHGASVAEVFGYALENDVAGHRAGVDARHRHVGIE